MGNYSNSAESFVLLCCSVRHSIENARSISSVPSHCFYCLINYCAPIAPNYSILKFLPAASPEALKRAPRPAAGAVFNKLRTCVANNAFDAIIDYAACACGVSEALSARKRAVY